MPKKLHAKYYLPVLVALTTFLIYLPALRNGFVNWDDDFYVYDNPSIRSLDGAFFRWAFFGFHVSNWHPLTWVSHALDYALWGLNPLGHHLTSIILHAANTALVVALVLKLFEVVRDRSRAPSLDDRTGLVAAGVTGLLFGIHPMHVESVAWVAERKDLLCALFFLLSIMAYIRYASSQKSAVKMQRSDEHQNDEARQKNFFTDKHYLLALCFFVLALLSKPMAVSLPVVLLILDWYPLDRIGSLKTFWTMVVEKTPFIVLNLASSVITVLAQQAEGALRLTKEVPLSIRALAASNSLVAYLGKMLLPINLVPFYPYPTKVSLFSPGFLSSVLLGVAITVACITVAKRQKVWLSAWGYFVVTLLPVLGIIQAGGQAMADRYAYLPSLGPLLLIGLLVAGSAGKAEAPGGTGRNIRFAAGSLTIMVLIILSYLTIMQTGIWRSGIDLWNFAITKEPARIPFAYYNRGQEFMNRGRPEKAIEDYTTALTLDPLYREAFFNRGVALEQLGRVEEAMADYEKTISLDPSSYQALNNRGILYGKTGQLEKAIESFNQAVKVGPRYPASYLNRGFTYSLIGRREDALADLNKAIALDPQFAPAYLQRGKLLLSVGSRGPAYADLRRACELGIQEACGSAP